MPAPDLEWELGSVFDPVASCFVCGKCSDCGAKTLPAGFLCFQCGGSQISPQPVSGEGVLYSFTQIHVSPRFPTPYSVGYVDLDEGLRVLGHLNIPIRDLSCNMRVIARPDTEAPTAWSFHALGGSK